MQRIVIVISLLLIFGIFFWWWRGRTGGTDLNPTTKAAQTTPSQNQQKTDAHGCLTDANFAWCQQKQKCVQKDAEPCTIADVSSTVNSLITKIAAATQITFLHQGTQELPWQTNQEGTLNDKQLIGMQYQIQSVETFKLDELIKYFEGLGFIWHKQLETEFKGKGVHGFSKDNLVCVLNFETSLPQLDENHYPPLPKDARDLTLTCGYIDMPAMMAITPNEVKP